MKANSSNKIIYLKVLMVFYFLTISNYSICQNQFESINFIGNDVIDSTLSNCKNCSSDLINNYIVKSNYTGIDTFYCWQLEFKEKVKVIAYFNNGEKIKAESFFENNKIQKSIIFDKENKYKTEFYKNGKLKRLYNICFDNRYSCNWDSLGNIKEITEGYNKEGYLFKMLKFDSLENVNFKDYKRSKNSDARNITRYYKPIESFSKICNNEYQQLKSFYENGNIKISGHIFQVELFQVGKWEEWYKNGVKSRQYYFNDNNPNVKEGTWLWWDENGELIKKETYKNNELIKQSIYNETKVNLLPEYE